MFAIRVTSGEEIQACDDDALTINQGTGALTVPRVAGIEEITTALLTIGVSIPDTAQPRRGRAAFARLDGVNPPLIAQEIYSELPPNSR